MRLCGRNVVERYFVRGALSIGFSLSAVRSEIFPQRRDFKAMSLRKRCEGCYARLGSRGYLSLKCFELKSGDWRAFCCFHKLFTFRASKKIA